MTGSYLAMMSDSLDKKIAILEKLQKENEKQKQILNSGSMADLDEFDATVETKGALIDELDQLNDGFDALFDQVREELDNNREKYRDEITALQDKIRTITALSGSIQAEEARNKKLAEQYFAGARKDIAKGQKSARAALDYYHNMARSTFTPPQYLDSRH